MRKRSWIFWVSFFIFIFAILCQRQESFPNLSGPYMGQSPPGNEPEVFAPGIVSTGLYDRDVAIMPDGNEFYFGVIVGNNTYSTIMVSKQIGGRWTRPEVVSFSGNPEYRELEPFISTDGKHFFFVSNRPDTARGETEGGDWDIWATDRIDDGWGEPYNLGPPINTDDGEFFPSMTRDGTLYFTRGGVLSRANFIYRSRLENGAFSEAEKLGPEVNSTQGQFNAFIAPDESYIIVPTFGRQDSFGGTDYYICFRNKDDTWSDPINMGEKINTAGGMEWSPYVTPDGKYFFFMSIRTKQGESMKNERLTRDRIMSLHNEPQNGDPDIYWVDAGFIEGLRPEGF